VRVSVETFAISLGIRMPTLAQPRSTERPARPRCRALRASNIEVVIAARVGVKYVKSTPNGEQPDNLLALPGCP
jgi:hypothetical protein